MTAPPVRRRIVFIRHEAFGDVLCLSPFLRQVRASDPGASIELFSSQGKALEGMSEFDRWLPLSEIPLAKAVAGGGERAYWFSYEHDPTLHILDGYECSTGLQLQDRTLAWDVAPEAKARVAEKMGAHPRPWIGFSPTSPHPLRSLPPARIQEAVDRLAAAMGGSIFLTSDQSLSVSGCVDLSGSLGFPTELGALMSQCDLWITVDSAPLHMAQALGVPAVGLFGCTLPELRATRPSHLQVVREETLPCLGCYHRLPAYAESLAACEREDIACMGNLDPDAIVDAARKALAGAPSADLEARIAAYERYKEGRLAGWTVPRTRALAEVYQRRIAEYSRRLTWFKRMERKIRSFRHRAKAWFKERS